MDVEELEEWEFKNIDDGRVKKIKAPDLETAWKELEKEYSDPLHAWQEWIVIE